MKKDIKIIGLDLDGTTLTTDKRITDRVKQSIEQAVLSGVTVLPATGRTVSGVPEEILSVKGIRYMLVSNGARIYDRQEEKTLLEVCMSKETAEQVMDITAPYDVQLNPYVDGKAYITKKDMEELPKYVAPEFLKYFRTTREIVDDLAVFLQQISSGVEKINIVFANMDERQNAWEELSRIPDLAITTSSVNNLEINHIHANKGDALISLGNLWGIEKEQIMACGDSGNDYAMIEKVGFGVAMGNAAEEIKKIADFITLSNEEDGVAYAIEKFVL